MAKWGIVPISKKHLANRDLGAGAVDKTVDLGQRWWPVMTGGYAIALGLYADATKILPNFGLIDIVALSLVGAMILTCISLVSFAAYRHTRPVLPPPRDRKEFTEEVVKLSDLVDGGAPLLSHKTFKRCIIRGPGQLKFQSKVEALYCSIEDRNIVTAPVGSNITGAVIVANCIFVECFFDGLALIGTPEDILGIRNSFEIAPLSDWEARYVR